MYSSGYKVTNWDLVQDCKIRTKKVKERMFKQSEINEVRNYLRSLSKSKLKRTTVRKSGDYFIVVTPMR